MRALAVVLGSFYALVVFFLLALGWFTWRESLASHPTPEPLAAMPSAIVRRESPPVRPTVLTPPAPGLARESAVEPPVEPLPPEPVIDEGRVALFGTILAIDAQGEVHWSESGSFDLEFRSGEHFASVAIPVREGRFDSRVPANVAMTIRGVELGGRPARPETERLQWDPELDVVLTARWPPGSQLRVKGADTHGDLGEVEVAKRLALPAAWIHPGPVPAGKIERSKSPLPLPELLGRRVYWVRAPGYAWGRVEVDHDQGGERVLELQPAAELRVELRGSAPPAQAALRLYGGPFGFTPAPVLELDLSGVTPIDVRDLAAGPYEVRVELGSWWRDPELLASAPVELAAHQRASVELELGELPAAGDAVTLEGTLALPGEYRGMRISLALSRLEGGVPEARGALELLASAMSPSQTSPGELAWSAGLQKPGTYLAEVRPLSVRQVLALAAGENPPVHIVVPRPAELVLRPLDARTGELVPDAVAQWHLVPPGELATWDRETVRGDPATRLVRIRAPQGTVAFAVQAPGYASQEGRLELEAGGAELEVRLERPCEIRVLLADGGTTLPCASSLRLEAREVNGEGIVKRWGVDGSACVLGVSKSGLYEVSVSGLAGYAQPTPLTAFPEPGKTAEITFHLQRLP
jgi:hypothetical protein